MRLQVIGFRIFLLLLLGTFGLYACATHEIILSKKLVSVVNEKELGFMPSHFRARVQFDTLEVWTRVQLEDENFAYNFDKEIQSAAALCASLAKSDSLFESEWRVMELQLTTQYGSQWRWKNTYGDIKVSLTREELLALRENNVPASKFPDYWQVILLVKVGPPNYLPLEFPLQEQ